MATFINILEPTITRAKAVSRIPEAIQKRYMVLINLLGLKGFDYTKTSDSGYDLDGTGSGSFDPSVDYNVFPAIVVDINESLVASDAKLSQLFFAANANPSILLTGIDGFKAGSEYYINETLYTFLLNTGATQYTETLITVPDYYDADWEMDSTYWEDLSEDPYRFACNIEYFYKRNKMLDFTFTEDELNNFYSTFCTVILENTKIDAETLASGNNPIYNQVLNYYKNFQTDATSTGIGLILSTLYGSASSTTTSCSCNSDLSEDGTSTATCAELYATAMETYLKQMLGDSQFYYDWFMIPTECEDEYLPNDVLIDLIVELINEFIEMENSLQFTKNQAKNCDCPVVSYDENDCNYDIIKQYLKVMGYCSDNVIDANVNKIKVYGQAFAELLPKLIFS